MHIGIQKETPKIPKDISEELRDFIESCLKINPQERLSAPDL